MRFTPVPGRLPALLLAAILTCFALSAQTSSDLRTYSTEVVVPLAQIGAFPPPSISAADLAAIAGGALQIRHSVTFTEATRRMSVRTFLVPPASPNPTPPAAQNILHESYEVNVENILWAPTTIVPPGTTPAVNTLVITGRIAGGGTSIGGDLANRLFIHSVGFDRGATPARFNNVTTVVSGRYVIYATQGTGTLTYGPQAPEPEPEPEGIKVTPSAGANATTALPEIQLSALVENSQGALTYSWRSVGKSASVIGPNTATPRVQFGQGFGEYIFEVTVIDNTGAMATGRVTVTYVGR
jgi:hypothetical protein